MGLTQFGSVGASFMRDKRSRSGDRSYNVCFSAYRHLIQHITQYVEIKFTI